MTVKIAAEGRIIILIPENFAQTKSPAAETTKRLQMKNLPTLGNDSSFAVQFSISVSKTTAILLFKIKIKLIEIFELHERMRGMRSVEY